MYSESLLLLATVGLFVGLQNAAKNKQSSDKSLHSNHFSDGNFNVKANRNRQRLRGENHPNNYIEGANVNFGRCAKQSFDKNYFGNVLNMMYEDDQNTVYLQEQFARDYLKHHNAIVTGYGDRATVIFNSWENN